MHTQVFVSPVAVAYAGALLIVVLGMTITCGLVSPSMPCPEPAVLFLVAAAAALAGGAGMSRRFQRARQALQRYVPDAVAQHILHGNNVTHGEQRDVSVLFVDLRDYSSRVENSTPEEIYDLLARFSLAVSCTIHQYGGSITEFGGDGMMAVFGAPDPLADKERVSIEAARAIVDTVGGLVEPGGDDDGRRIEVGVGVASGPAFTGIIPAADRLVWSAVGNTTNLASRLQGLTRELDVPVAVDEATWRGAGASSNFERHPDLAIRGRSHGENVYTLAREACRPTPDSGRTCAVSPPRGIRVGRHGGAAPAARAFVDGRRILAKTRSTLIERNIKIFRGSSRRPARAPFPEG